MQDLANDERITAFTAQEQKAITRRIDIRLVITLGCLYCISLLDRTNLGAASVAGYVESLLPPTLISVNLTTSQNAKGVEHERNK